MRTPTLRFHLLIKSPHPARPNVMTGLAVLLIMAFLGPFSQKTDAAESRYSLVEYSVMAPMASRSLLLGIVKTPSNRLVCVGQRGHILFSDDQGENWKQAKVPTRNLLTAVFFADSQNGWAVGHDAIILATTDGGENWSQQFIAPDKEKPLLQVWFKDAQNGVAIGAYGLYMETTDGGKTWHDNYYESLDDPEFGLVNFNAISRIDDQKILMAGEAGFLALSEDLGQTWTPLDRPYEGSYFNILVTQSGTILVYGLRGNIYRSTDQAKTWKYIKSDVTDGLNSGIQTDDGIIMLVGMNGVVLKSQDDGQSFEVIKRPDRISISDIVWLGNGDFVIAGEDGIHRMNQDGMDQTDVKPRRK